MRIWFDGEYVNDGTMATWKYGLRRRIHGEATLYIGPGRSRMIYAENDNKIGNVFA